MKSQNTINSLLLAMFVLLLAYSLWEVLTGEEEPHPSQLLGNPAPEFTLESFDGGKVSLSDFRGKTLLVNFWASWCGPCRTEAPELESAYEELSGEKVEFIGINVMDDMAGAEKYLESAGGNFVNVFDPENRVHLDYGVNGVPETFFISPEGIVTDSYLGPLTKGMIMDYMEKAASYDMPNGGSETS